MAVRYSGDVEVRVLWDPRKRIFVGSVRDPYVRCRCSAPRPTAVRGKRILHRSSESYDLMALLFLRQAARWAKETRNHVLRLEQKRGHIVVRRIFQAPCPIETKHPTRRKGRCDVRGSP